MTENAVFLKGSAENLTSDIPPSDAAVFSAYNRLQFMGFPFSGAKVLHFHLRPGLFPGKVLPQSAVFILRADEAEHVRAMVEEVMDIINRKDKAGLWEWMIRALLDKSTGLQQNTLLMVAYVRQGDSTQYNHILQQYAWHGKDSLVLQIKDCPKKLVPSLLPVLTQIMEFYKININQIELLSLAIHLDTPGFSEACIQKSVFWFAQADQSLSSGSQRSSSAVQGGGYVVVTPERMIQNALMYSRIVLQNPHSTYSQKKRAARLLILSQKLQLYFKIINIPTLYLNAEYCEWISAFAKFDGSAKCKSLSSTLIPLLAASENGSEFRPNAAVAEALVREAQAFNQYAASRLNMCADPVIDSLTGGRNWWGCHNDEGERVQTNH